MFLHFFSEQVPANPPKPCKPLEVLQAPGAIGVCELPADASLSVLVLAHHCRSFLELCASPLFSLVNVDSVLAVATLILLFP